jgi:hypothetical protein
VVRLLYAAAAEPTPAPLAVDTTNQGGNFGIYDYVVAGWRSGFP